MLPVLFFQPPGWMHLRFEPHPEDARPTPRPVGIFGVSYEHDISVLKGIPWYSVDMKIHRVAACAAKIGVHKNTVKAWSRKGKLPDRRTPAGHRHCTDAAVERYFGVERAPEAGRTVVHGRVSRRAQGDDLRPQPQAMETFRLGAVWR